MGSEREGRCPFSLGAVLEQCGLRWPLEMPSWSLRTGGDSGQQTTLREFRGNELYLSRQLDAASRPMLKVAVRPRVTPFPSLTFCFLINRRRHWGWGWGVICRSRGAPTCWYWSLHDFLQLLTFSTTVSDPAAQDNEDLSRVPCPTVLSLDPCAHLAAEDTQGRGAGPVCE